MIFRPFCPADSSACLAVFDSNVPRTFSPWERPQFGDFLTRPPGQYWVLCDQVSNIVGCGGMAFESAATATLTWGMIHAGRQGQGLGRLLLMERLRQVTEMPEVRKVVLNTSQVTVGFYLRFGFREVKVTANGYREGLHRHDLELMVTDEWRKQVGAGAG